MDLPLLLIVLGIALAFLMHYALGIAVVVLGLALLLRKAAKPPMHQS